MEEDTAIIWYASDSNTMKTPNVNERLLDEDLNACLTIHLDLQSCVTQIESLPKMYIYCITSAADARDILPLIHQMRQIDSVFVLSYADENVKDLLDKYSKIITCLSDQKALTKSIREHIQLAQRQKLVFSFYNQHKKPTRQLSKESALFLWFQLLKNALLNFPSDDTKAKDDLVNFLRQRYRNNNKQIKLIDDFAEKYQANDAIHWYTGQPFLYRHVNKALRTEDVDQLFTFRRFIGDLSKQLLSECKAVREYAPSVTLYRGTRILNDEYDTLRTNMGNLISINGFLSTSLMKEVAMTFADKSTETHHAVVFEIQCNLDEVETVILAPIIEFSANKTEQEVLIDIGAVFRLLSVEEQDTIAWIKMKATDEGTTAVKRYLEINQAELKEKNARLIWGDLLLDMGYHDKALEYFQKLQDLDSDVQEWQLQIHIGHALSEKGLYEDAKEHYIMAAELWDRQSSDVNISILSHLSALMIQAGNFEETRIILLAVLQIYQDDTKMEHDRIYYHDIASILTHLGHCFFELGDYDQAIKYFNDGYEIRETYYASDHLENAGTLCFLGMIYRIKGDCKRALHYFSHATAIYDRILPSDHPKLVGHWVNIAQIYADQNRKEESLEYLHKALILQQKNTSDIMVDKVLTFDIGSLIAFLEKDEEKTIALTRDSLEMKRIYLFKNHPSIALDLTTLGNVLKELGRNDEAMVYYTEALGIYEHLKPDGRPETAIVLHGLGFVHCANDDYDTALSYYIRAQAIYDRYFVLNNPNRICLLLSIAEVHQLKGNCSLAIDALKDCLTVVQKSRPINEMLLGRIYMMLADTYMFDGNVIAALYEYEKALSIEVDDDIDHYVYMIGYRLLMLSCNLKFQGEHQRAQLTHKNATIIFQQLDKFHLFDLVEKLIKLSINDLLNNGVLSLSENFQRSSLMDSMKIRDIFHELISLPSNDIEFLSTQDQILYYYYSMALYQQLFIDVKHRSTAIVLLGDHYDDDL